MSNNEVSTGSVKPHQAADRIQNHAAWLLDVREWGEFAVGHADGASCVPLSGLAGRIAEIPSDRPILIMCQSGHRSAIAASLLRKAGRTDVAEVSGGFAAWKKDGLPTIRLTGAIPLERQVRIGAGIFVLGFSLLGLKVRPFSYGAIIVGAMLVLTGILGICPMMSVLKALPWNRSAQPQ